MPTSRDGTVPTYQWRFVVTTNWTALADDHQLGDASGRSASESSRLATRSGCLWLRARNPAPYWGRRQVLVIEKIRENEVALLLLGADLCDRQAETSSAGGSSSMLVSISISQSSAALVSERLAQRLLVR